MHAMHSAFHTSGASDARVPSGADMVPGQKRAAAFSNPQMATSLRFRTAPVMKAALRLRSNYVTLKGINHFSSNGKRPMALQKHSTTKTARQIETPQRCCFLKGANHGSSNGNLANGPSKTSTHPRPRRGTS